MCYSHFVTIRGPIRESLHEFERLYLADAGRLLDVVREGATRHQLHHEHQRLRSLNYLEQLRHTSRRLIAAACQCSQCFNLAFNSPRQLGTAAGQELLGVCLNGCCLAGTSVPRQPTYTESVAIGFVSDRPTS